MTRNNNHYNKNLQPFANKNRKQMTKAESCLWKFVLRAKQTGVVFNRQRPCLKYVADFMCKELKLIIEVDGYTHLLKDVIINDKIRQTNLENTGFKILRFKDDEVLKEIDIVRNKIFKTIKIRILSFVQVLPPPLKRGICRVCSAEIKEIER